MKYLVLSADYMEFSLRDQHDDDADPTGGLSAALREDLEDWNREYQPVVQASPGERNESAMAAEIARLDRRGLSLAGSVREELDDAKEVRYYSEGKLRYLSASAGP